MNKEKLRAYIALYEEGAFFLHTEKDWAALYAVATPRHKITSRHLFQIPFAESAYNYGYRKTSNKKIYEQELISISENKVWCRFILGKSQPLSESDGRIQFRGKN